MKTRLTILFVFLIGCCFGQSYSTQNKKAIVLFEQAKDASHNSLFPKSLALLQKVIALDPTFLEAYLLNSDIYQELDSISLQIKVLEAAKKIDPSSYPKLHYTLGNAYYRSGFYQKAIDSYAFYLDMVGSKATFSGKARQNMDKCKDAVTLLKSPVPFNAINLGPNINSPHDDYWPSLTVDGQMIIFNRLVDDQSNQGRSLGQEDFYTSSRGLGNNEWQPSEPLSSINTSFNEGAQSLSSDGRWLFFTACNRNDGLGSCDIYFSRNRGGTWSIPQNVGQPVNSPSWESQPSISANGESLYFVSNRKGGKGGMDIWKCDLLGFSDAGNPIWSNAINLGDSINSPGNENSPFIHADNKTLYFASDYWPGMGGFDIFYARKLNDVEWGKPHNIGYPINSYKDEQGLIVDASGKNAYYSSDRPGSQKKDIYSFEIHQEARPTPVSYVKGIVVDSDTGEPLNAHVELVDLYESSFYIKGESSLEHGEFLLCLPVGKEYAFTVSKEGYLFYSENFRLNKKMSLIDPFILEVKLKKIEVGGSIILRNVFFETGSHELLPESMSELKRVVELLITNKTLSIELEGHTDNLGTEEMNLDLSESRAEEVYNYLVGKGIEASRMNFRGYGYSKPISTNETAEGRALNRRTEFKITRK